MKTAELPLQLLLTSKAMQKTHLHMVIIIGITVLFFSQGIDIKFAAEDFLFLKHFGETFGDAWDVMLASSRVWPVGVVYRWVLFQLFGFNPEGYHLTSYLFHGINILLVYILFLRLSKSKMLGAGAALVFAIYPRHHQPVLWMSGNLVPLSSSFFFLGLIFFHRYLSSHKNNHYFAFLIFLSLALLTLEGTIILFPLIFVIEVLFYSQNFNGDQKWFDPKLLVRQFKKYIPIAIVFMLFAVLTFGGNRIYKLWAADEVSSVDQFGELGFTFGDTYRFSSGVNTIKELASYTIYAVFPHIPLRALDPTPITLVFTGMTLLFLLLLLLRGSNLLKLAVLWVILSVLPYPFFATFGNADRYFYLAAPGYGLLLATLILEISNRVRQISPVYAKLLIFMCVSIYIVLSGAILQQRIHEWRTAGILAEGIVDQAILAVPDPQPGMTILYVGLPQQYGQAYVFMSAFTTAIRLKYEDRAEGVIFYQTHDEQTIDYLRNATDVEKPVENLSVLLYDEGKFVDKSSKVSDIASIQPYSFFQW
jgi:hypothetical protein